jgi:hypothetical protein
MLREEAENLRESGMNFNNARFNCAPKVRGRCVRPERA